MGFVLWVWLVYSHTSLLKSNVILNAPHLGNATCHLCVICAVVMFVEIEQISSVIQQ